MRRLFLHIGAHKTGTTALQQGLHHNRILLRALGCSYAASLTAAHLHGFLGPVTPGSFLPQGFMVLDPDGLSDRLAAAETETVVASSENFSFFFQKSAIAALAETLRPQFDQIRIVCYLRRQDRHAVSHHQEGAKPHRQVEGELWGHAPTALPDHSPAHELYLDYNQRLGLWADVFGDDAMDIRVYDRSLLKEGDIFTDFLALLKYEVRGLQSVGERNVSLGAAQTKAGHLMNSVGIRPKVADAILNRITPEGRLLPGQAQARAFMDRYVDGNCALNQRFGISDNPDLFSMDFADYPEIPHSDWTEAGATSAVLAALGQLNDVEPAMAALTADDLRTAAQALQTTSPDMALRLITAAHALRPAGPAILRLKSQLERQAEAAAQKAL
jgi:hypothetical protein